MKTFGEIAGLGSLLGAPLSGSMANSVQAVKTLPTHWLNINVTQHLSTLRRDNHWEGLLKDVSSSPLLKVG